MTSDDVSSLAESTRDLMLKTLESISQPASSSSDNLQSMPKISGDVADTPAEVERETGATKDGLQIRSDALADDEKGIADGSEMRKVDSRGGETTDDEMDEDAVLLKRPIVT